MLLHKGHYVDTTAETWMGSEVSTNANFSILMECAFWSVCVEECPALSNKWNKKITRE